MGSREHNILAYQGAATGRHVWILAILTSKKQGDCRMCGGRSIALVRADRELALSENCGLWNWDVDQVVCLVQRHKGQ
jgi:hypothetical protein